MSWLEIQTLLKERPRAGIPADLVAAIEAETILRQPWWQSEIFRLRWTPTLVGLATAFGVLWLSKIQKHPNARAVIPIAARPQAAPVTLHASLPFNEASNQEKGERRENPKS